MKTSYRLAWIAMIMVLALPLIFAACDGGGEGPSAQEMALKILKSKTWQISSVKVDGLDHTQDFSGLTISFTDNSIKTSNGGALWQSEDTWQFTDTQATSFKRGDGVDVEISTLTSSLFEVKLSWSEKTFGPGRTNSINGEYMFRFE